MLEEKLLLEENQQKSTEKNEGQKRLITLRISFLILPTKEKIFLFFHGKGKILLHKIEKNKYPKLNY